MKLAEAVIQATQQPTDFKFLYDLDVRYNNHIDLCHT